MVTMKTIFFVLISYYRAKEWIECQKWKQLVRRELNRMMPNLHLFNANREFWLEKQKKFKVNYTVISTTMQVLPDASIKEFFSSTKQMQNKNKTMEQLFSYIKEFFQIFLKQKKDLKKTKGQAFFHPYDGMSVKLGPWVPCSWNQAQENLKIGIINTSRKTC